MRLSICVAVVCGLLLFVYDSNAAKVKCKDGSCSVSTTVEKSKTATAAKTVEQSAVTTTKEKRVKRHGKFSLHLPRLFKKGCKSC